LPQRSIKHLQAIEDRISRVFRTPHPTDISFTFLFSPGALHAPVFAGSGSMSTPNARKALSLASARLISG
jgi:hypothetical protein